MQLRDLRNILVPRSREDLKDIADKLGLNSTRNFIPEITNHLSHPDGVAETLEALKPNQKSLIKDLLFLMPLTRFKPDADRLRKTEGFKLLGEYGLVNIGRNHLGASTILLGEESVDHMMKVVNHWEATKISKKAFAEASRVRANSGNFLRNVATLIALTAFKSLPLTREGSIAKTYYKKRIEPFMEFGEFVDKDIKGRFPADFEDVVAFCKLYGLIEFKETEAESSEAGFSFLNAEVNDVVESLKFYAQQALQEIDSTRVLDLLASLPDSSLWVNTKDVIPRLISALYPKKIKPDVIEDWNTAVKLLGRVGLIEVAYSEDDSTAVRLCHLLRHDDTSPKCEEFFITPDFKISAPRNLEFTIRHELFHFCRFLKADQMDQWEITRNSIGDALDQGRSIEQIFEFIENHSAVTLPSNVKSSLELWAIDHRSVRYYQAPVLIVDSEREQQLISAVIETLGAEVERPAENIFILKDHLAEAVLAKIKERRSVNILKENIRKESSVQIREIISSKKTDFGNPMSREPGTPA